MKSPTELSRRLMLAAAGAMAAFPHAALAALPTAEEKANLPIIPRKVVKMFNKAPRLKEPNALQFAPDGNLWVLDQVDANKVFTVNPADGSILAEVQTESMHGSGITLGHGAWWITSTKALASGGDPMTLKVDIKTGKTLKKWRTPGSGLYGRVTTPSGGHGIRWVDGKYWMAVPAASLLYLIDPESGKVIRTLPAPTVRTHDVAWSEGALWVVGTEESEIYKVDPKTGKLLAKIQIGRDEPAVHGFDINARGEGVYCDAATGWFCKLV